MTEEYWAQWKKKHNQTTNNFWQGVSYNYVLTLNSFKKKCGKMQLKRNILMSFMRFAEPTITIGGIIALLKS